MSPLLRSLAELMVTARRILVRHPWLYWLIVAAVATGFGLSQRGRSQAIDTERDAWGETVEVVIAVSQHAPGDIIDGETRAVPRAVVPASAVDADDAVASVARQRIGPGEIVTVDDIAPAVGPTALAPDGWVVVPVEESTPAGADIGESVLVVSDGFVIAADAMVVGSVDRTMLVAVPLDQAAIIPAASAAAGVTLVRRP